MLDLVLEILWWVWIALLLIFSISFMIFSIFKDTDKDTSEDTSNSNDSNADSTARRNIILFKILR